MSKVLTLELNDDVYKVLQQQASAVGISVAELVATSLNRQYSLLVSPQSDVTVVLSHITMLWLS